MTETAESSLASLHAAYAQWKQTVVTELKGASFEKKLVTGTFEGIALQPLYTRADVAAVRGLDLPPGAAPFLRGVRASGYKDHSWKVAQEIAAATPAAFNAALVADLMLGQDSVVLAPNAATRAGTGIPLATSADFAAALAHVDLQAVPVQLRAGADALPLAALYLGLAQSRGTSWSALSGSVAADPIGEWLESGCLPTRLDRLYDSLAGWTAWAAQHASSLRTIGVNAALWGDAGGTAVQELAFALAATADYVRALATRGVTPETAASRLQFRFAIGPQFFNEVAKFRAWRPLLTRVLVAFGAPAPAVAGAAVHAVTGRWNKTQLDPHVNLLRVTTEALSAVLGGCDSLHIAPFDELTAGANETSRRIARNVHTLLAEEFSFREVADAAGGSWFVEKLTDEVARKAWALFQDIEGRGGLAAALRAGYPQQLIAEASGEKDKAVTRRRLTLVGTNLFPNLKEDISALRVPPAPAAAARASEAAGAAAGVPAATPWATRFEMALAAAKRGASADEIARLTGTVESGETVITPVASWRAAARFENLRAASAALGKRTGSPPKVFLAKMGPPVQHKARADFSAGFFAVGGFAVLAKQAFDTPAAAASAAANSGAGVVVLCSTDETYPLLVPAFAAEVKRLKPDVFVVLAGLPADAAVVAAFRAAGVDEFIHVRADVTAILTQILSLTGATS